MFFYIFKEHKVLQVHTIKIFYNVFMNFLTSYALCFGFYCLTLSENVPSRLVRKWSLNTGVGRTDKFRERIKIWIHCGSVTNLGAFVIILTWWVCKRAFWCCFEQVCSKQSHCFASDRTSFYHWMVAWGTVYSQTSIKGPVIIYRHGGGGGGGFGSKQGEI